MLHHGRGEGSGESSEGEESGGGQWERGCDESTDSECSEDALLLV